MGGKGLEAPKGQGCPACNCYVYHADQVGHILTVTLLTLTPPDILQGSGLAQAVLQMQSLLSVPGLSHRL